MGELLNHKNWPISGAGLDFIKIMAAILMLIDHIDHIVLDREAVGMFFIGRGAYPLFAFACAASFIRGGLDKAPKYAKNLILWGLIVVPVSWMTRDTTAANILFTLAIGAGLLPFLIKIGVAGRAVIFTSAVLSLYFTNIVEFGFLGALAPAGFYLVMTGQKDGTFWLVITLALMNFGGFMHEVEGFGAIEILIMFFVAAATIGFSWLVLKLAEGMKRNEKRLLSKYFLHIFYPAHMIGLALIKPFV